MRDVPLGTKYKVTAGAGSAAKVADKAMGKTPEPKRRRGRMNKTEAAYALHLAAQQHIGQINLFLFESVKLRLADKTWYCPDFLVWFTGAETPDFHEIKGFERDDAIVKFKCAAELFHRFRFKMIKRVNGEWVTTRDSWS